MVSSDLWTDIYSRLNEVFMIIPENLFGGISVLTVADLPKLFSSLKKTLQVQYETFTIAAFI